MVQIYENPNGHTAFGIATQHNPEFAALNSITAGWADGPITEALGNMELQDKFGGLKGALKMKQLERKWGKGDKKEDWLNKLKFLQASKGYNPSNLNDIDTAFKSFALGNKEEPIQIPGYLGTLGQNSTGSVPNFAQMSQNGVANVPQFSQQDFINALTGYDLSDKVQNLSALHTKYVEDPKSVSQDELNTALNDLTNARKLQKEKATGSFAGQFMNEGNSISVNSPLATWLQSFNDKDIANKRFNQLPKWAQLRNNDGFTKTIAMSKNVADSQKFMNAVYEDLASKNLHEVDPQVVQNLVNNGVLRINPYEQILVQDGSNAFYLYNTKTGETTQVY